MTIAEFEKALELASQEELAGTYTSLLAYPQRHPDAPYGDQVAWLHVMCMIEAEAERRKVEPLWRKAKRLALRNPEQLGCCALGLVIGAFLG